MSVANFKEKIPKKKRTPGLVSSSVSTVGMSLFSQIIVCHGPPCTTQTVLLLILQGKNSSNCWLMLLSPQHQMYLILFCFKVSFIHKPGDIVFYFHCIYHCNTSFILLNLVSTSVTQLLFYLIIDTYFSFASRPIVLSVTLVTVLSHCQTDIKHVQSLQYF